MNPNPVLSPQAARAFGLVEALQTRFVRSLEELGGVPFQCNEWARDDGRHGGGRRYGIADSDLLGRASVNVSQVYYHDEPERSLASASALSAIVHPVHPLAPSVHIHLSWTELKNGSGYWRIMADLNPAVPRPEHTARFVENLQKAAPDLFSEAAEQGDQYFYIPALQRHRGVTHFYLENFNSGHFSDDLDLATRIGETAIDTYRVCLNDTFPAATDAEYAAQLAYHTLYFFQVLTLDRGTTAGLLVHNQNDVGILGSLPPRVDAGLLAAWREPMPKPQDQLLDRILELFPQQGVCEVDESIKQRLADAVRAHYQHYPQALELQASAHSIPPTIENHRSSR